MRHSCSVKSSNTLPAETTQRLRQDPHFLLDCLYFDDAEVRAAALGRLDDFQPVMLHANPDSIRELEAMSAARRPKRGTR